MIDPARDLPAPCTRASLHLDDASGLQKSTGAVAVSERGLRLLGPWTFSIGTQLKLSLDDLHPRLGLCHLHLEGIVVWCEPTADGLHETTVLFLECPEEIRPSLRQLSHLHPALPAGRALT